MQTPWTRSYALGLACALSFSLPALVAASGCTKDPAHDDHDDHDDHDEPESEEHGDDIRLTPKQLANSKIRSVRVGPGRLVETLELTATVEENLDAEAHVNPRVPGIVKEIHKGLGDRVEVGDPLCEIDSTELGNAVASFLESAALLEMGKAVLAAETELLERGVEVARRIFAREKDLFEKEISTLRPYYDADRALSEAEMQMQRRVLELQTESKRRAIQLRAAQARLEALGLDETQIATLAAPREPGAPEPPELHGHYLIRAPRKGIVVKRDVTTSEYVDERTTLFRIDDLERVWVVASVYEKDLARVRTGQTAKVRLTAFPGTVLEGTVTLIGYEVEAASRAVPIRIELANVALAAWPERDPVRPGMFGAVELVTREREAAVVVPEAALVHEGAATFVFVREDEHTFERRAVHVSAHAQGVCEVISGLEVGEDVVVEGTFVLKSVARSAELGGGHSH